MNYKSHSLSLAKYIESTKSIWSCEVMNEYPQSINAYDPKWLEELAALSADELFDFDCKRPVAKLNDSKLMSFLNPLLQLCQLHSLEMDSEKKRVPQLENWAYQGVKKKKRHEIDQMAPEIQKVFLKLKCLQVVDIGGGVGHLARILAHYYQIPTISIDQNKEFQEIGAHRLKKFRKLPGAKDVRFINATLDFSDKNLILKNEIDGQSFLLGLHTCGALGNTLLRAGNLFQSRVILSFGCCYYRLNPDSDLWMSQFFQENKFCRLNLFGLTLATRSHAEDDRSTFETKIRVKMYRNALHLFLLEKYNNKHETDVGECPIHIYWRPFAQYISMKLSELKIDHQYTHEDFEIFYNSIETQKKLKQMIFCNLIRWQLGRALEIFLLLDRALYLEENEYDVSFKTYFQESLSPRNIGILAEKRF